MMLGITDVMVLALVQLSCPLATPGRQRKRAKVAPTQVADTLIRNKLLADDMEAPFSFVEVEAAPHEPTKTEDTVVMLLGRVVEGRTRNLWRLA